MRLTSLFSWLLLCGAVACLVAPASAQSGSRVAGHILVAKVRGQVNAATTNVADGSVVSRALVDNDRISQDYTVTTGAGASVILIFSNGATLNLGADSVLVIKEFLQDPFSDAIKVSDMKEEPTTSTTRLKLERGELVGDVKHLRHEAGSEFNIDTPVGAAGIRGTTFRIVFKPDASGKVFFTLTTDTGEVVFKAPAAADISVPADQEVVVAIEATVDTTTGQITVTSAPTFTGTTDASVESKAAITTAVAAIVEQSKQAIIDSTQQAADKAAADKAAADKAAADKAAAEKEAADKAAAEKAAAEKEAADKAAAEKAAAEKEAADKAAAEKAAADKAAADKAAADQAAADQAAADRVAADKAAADKAAADKLLQDSTPPPNTAEKQTTSGDGA